MIYCVMVPFAVMGMPAFFLFVFDIYFLIFCSASDFFIVQHTW